jgi:uncharacterized coiled-coil protein SlyX
MSDLATRLAELELRIAEQDRVIADLNEMVVSQWRKIDNLERRFGELREEFDTAAAARSRRPGASAAALLTGRRSRIRPAADVLGPKPALAYSSMSNYIVRYRTKRSCHGHVPPQGIVDHRRRCRSSPLPSPQATR